MIYLDNAATTKPNQAAVKNAMIWLTEYYFNPSAMYREGFERHREIKAARENILPLVADPLLFDLEFTSCGTESDNQAIFVFAKRGNAVTTEGEHSAVSSSFAELKNRGVEPRFAPLQADGKVDVEKLLALVDERTSFVSVIHVNNETGAINDVNAIAKAVKAKNPRVVFHVDGVQSFGKLPYRLGKEVDLYAFSAHKIGGIKGVGGLIYKKKLHMLPYVYGGGQEGGLRSGTENVFGIKVLEYAAREKYENRRSKFEEMKRKNALAVSLLDSRIFERISGEEASPYILSMTGRGVRGEILLHRVDDRGVMIGTGSACSSNAKKRYSRVILACGYDDTAADGVIRISFSDETSEEEIRTAMQIINEEARSLKEELQ
ncbi:MAG: cysteine desulfurase family protein [Christensenellaceae bacterium]